MKTKWLKCSLTVRLRIMLNKKNLLILLFSLKIILDFFCPYRDVNFAIIVAVFLIAALLNIKDITKLSRSESKWIGIFLLISFLAFLNSDEPRELYKYLSLVLIYLVTRSIVSRMSADSISSAASVILKLFIIAFALNYGLSWVVASPINREFHNFEHANLLGSYVLISLSLVYCLKSPRESLTSRIKILLAAVVTTSTGAALLAAVSFFDFKKYNVKYFFVIALTLAFFSLALYVVLQSYSPLYFSKIFGPLTLIADGKLSDLGNLARAGIPIQELGDEYQSSLAWRFYAYYIFIDFIGTQNLYTLFFGAGFWGFSKAWNGIMPHNDFILALIDFGILGFAALVIAFYQSFKFVVRKFKTITPLLLILTLRLLFENNIYSFYLTSSLVMCSIILYFFVTSKNHNE